MRVYTSSPSRFLAKASCAFLGACALFALVPGSGVASPTVFFGGWYDDAVGSIGFDGSRANPKLIDNDDTIPMAMTVAGPFLYWQSNSLPVRIGRSRLDGSEVQTHFIEVGAGNAEVEGVSVSDRSIYWTENPRGGTSRDVLNRARLDGLNVEDRVLTFPRSAEGPVTVDDGFAYYQIESYRRGIVSYAIARQRLGKSSITRLVGHRQMLGEVLVLEGRYVYWLEYGGDDDLFIGRAAKSKGAVNTRFRRVPKKGCHVRSEVSRTAISGRFLFIGCENGDIDRVAMRGRRGVLTLRTHAQLSSGPVLAATP